MSACRLVLSPASERGWFGGRALVAHDVVRIDADVSLSEAGHALQAEFEGSGSGLTAVLAAYDGVCTVVRFSAVSVGVPDAALPPAPLSPADPLLTEVAWDLAPRAFRAGVEEVRERIAAGDVYVLNLTTRLRGTLAVDGPDAAFAVLEARAAADMAALFTGLPGATPWIASVSPERFLRVRRDGRGSDAPLLAQIEPIKGTRPRGSTPEADERLAAELLASHKERAEHVMVVDMERNDLGVNSVPGSVHVEPLYEVVATPYCHQLVSTVRSTLRPETTFADLLEATFPCGSVTGAPKRAAMSIIAGLEATARGVYCGALLVAMPGEMDSSVLIRTLEGEQGESGSAFWGTGAGLTYDSDSAAEYLEVLLKASPVTGDGTAPVALRETMRVAAGRVSLLDRHLARLASGGVGPSVLARVREAIAELLLSPEAAAPYARLGVSVTADGSVSVGLSSEPSSLCVAHGPRIAAIEVAAASALPPAAAKPASRRFWDRAHTRAGLAGADQAVLHTPDGVLIDGSTATLWLVRDGGLLTPLSPPAVAGVARELVFDVARAAGISARECRLTLADLEAADEVWLSNAVGGFVPSRGRGGPVGERIARYDRAGSLRPSVTGGA